LISWHEFYWLRSHHKQFVTNRRRFSRVSAIIIDIIDTKRRGTVGKCRRHELRTAGDQVKEDKMGGLRSMHRRDEKYM